MSDFINDKTETAISSSIWSTSAQPLINISKILCNENDKADSCARALSFMTYELVMLTQGKSDSETLGILNTFFFESKSFKTHEKFFLLIDVLRERRGCGLALALVYMHLAESVGLHVELVHWPRECVLKWCSETKNHYIDLNQKGNLLDEDTLLLMINTHKEHEQTLSLHEAIKKYLTYILLNYKQANELEGLHKTLSLLLQLEPENTKLLTERALLRKELGLNKDSIADFKRLFSFTEKNNLPKEIITAYQQTQSLNETLV